MTEKERQELLGLDESRLSERDALALLARASRSATPSEIRDVKFPLTKFRWPRAHFVQTAFVDADLGAPFITWRPFRKRQFDECRFSRVSMDGLHVAHSLFRKCTFDQVVFGKKFYGYFGKCRFEDCTFEKCSFSYVGFQSCSFEGCQLAGVRGTRVSYRANRITNTRFAGRFGLVHFIDSDLADVDLSGCDLEEAALQSNSYQRVRLPEGPGSYFVQPDTLEGFQDTVDQRFSPEGAKWLRGIASAGDILLLSAAFFDEFNQLESDLLKEFLFPRRVAGEFTWYARPNKGMHQTRR